MLHDAVSTDDVPVNLTKLCHTDESDSTKAQLCTLVVIVMTVATYCSNNALESAVANRTPSNADDKIDRNSTCNLDNAFHSVDDSLVTDSNSYLRPEIPEDGDYNDLMLVDDYFHRLRWIAALAVDYHSNQLPPIRADCDYCGYVLAMIHYYQK